ncbi:MAG: hypothetical protein E3I13_01085, partial [Gammaproteobacteria bacterium]
MKKQSNILSSINKVVIAATIALTMGAVFAKNEVNLNLSKKNPDSEKDIELGNKQATVFVEYKVTAEDHNAAVVSL